MESCERNQMIRKLQDILNKTVTQTNLSNKIILDISRKLDILILEQCIDNLGNKLVDKNI